ncbi:MAG: histidine phosphatase family protein [Anaerolineae bacterium]
MRLLLTRHGQSRWQTEGSIAGGDSPLSPLGELQAHRLGVHLKRYETVDRIVASHLKRAHKTATIVASYLEMDLTVNPQLREFESDAAGRAPLPSSFWNPEPVEAPNPAHRGFLERVRGALCEILPDEEADETILVVAHGGTVGSILRVLLGATTQRLWTANTGLHLLEWREAYWLVHYVNNLEHLPRPLRSW